MDQQATELQALRVGNLVLPPGGRAALIGDKPVPLTRTEFQVLELLLQRAGTVVVRGDFNVAGGAAGSNVLEVMVSRLRRKLKAAGADVQLQLARGQGYRMQVSQP